MLKITILFVVLIMGLNCGSGSMTNSTQEWTTLKFSISGGFSGRGDGVVTVSHDGSVNIERARLQNKTVPECKGHLTSEEMTQLSNALSAAKTDKWNMEGPNMAAADAFELELVLSTGEGSEAKQKTIVWYDNTAYRLPDDVKGIVKILTETRKRIEKTCA